MKKYIFVLLAVITVTAVGTLGGHDKSPPGYQIELSTQIAVQHDALASANVIDMSQPISAESNLDTQGVLEETSTYNSYVMFKRYIKRWRTVDEFNQDTKATQPDKEPRIRLMNYPKLC